MEQAEKRKQLNDQWAIAIEEEVGDLISKLSPNQEVFTFTKSGQLKMGFSPRWEVILREVKQVSALRLKVKSRISNNQLRQKSNRKSYQKPYVQCSVNFMYTQAPESDFLYPIVGFIASAYIKLTEHCTLRPQHSLT